MADWINRPPASAAENIRDVRERLRSHGLRWTPQRRVLLDVLHDADGHVTGAQLVERCRARDPETTPSTVYRTLEVLEDLGLVKHSHGRDGRQEYHVAPVAEHGHAICNRCGATVELAPEDVGELVRRLATREFEADLSHLAVGGRCRICASKADASRGVPADDRGSQAG